MRFSFLHLGEPVRPGWAERRGGRDGWIHVCMYLHRYPAGEMSSCLGEGGVYSPASDDLVTRIGCSHWGFYDYIFVIYEKLQRRYTKKGD